MKKKIKFGLAIPTGTEGLMVNLPYASARDVVELSVFAEKIGLDSVWGNDHIHSQKYVLKEFGASPRYYSPLLELGRDRGTHHQAWRSARRFSSLRSGSLLSWQKS